MSQIFLRDLKDGPRGEYEREIRKKRPDLVPALEAGHDIAIGEGYEPKDHEDIGF